MRLLGILFTLLVTYVIYSIVREFILNSKHKEKFQNFADAYLWPFDRILQPIHYWLAQFSPSYYPSYNLGYHHIPFHPRFPHVRYPYFRGPWYSLTHY